MDAKDIDALAAALPELQLQRDVPWKEISILGIGAPVKVLVEPANDLELTALLRYASDHGVPVRTIGAGGNIVGSDVPFDGVILRLMRNNFSKINPSHVHVTVGAGVRLSDFLKECAGLGLGGVAPLAGIPGTVGGAVRMNAGAHGVDIKGIVEELCGVYPDGTQWCMDADQLNWQYRDVNIPDDLIITAAICKLNKVDPAEETAKIEEEFDWRTEHFPSGRSTGCVFRNPMPEVSAGKLIDEAGCRGLRIGGAVISDIHANFILNENDASEKEYIELIIKARESVLKNSGIYLIPEVHFMDPTSALEILNHPQQIKVVVLKGGNSNERNISLISAGGVEKALTRAGYQVEGIDIKELDEWDSLTINQSDDIVFPVLHGGFGENGQLHKLMERDGISFVGCGSEACRVSMDKLESKRILVENGLPTPDYAVISKKAPALPDNLTFPLVVKPPEEGSTVGISIVANQKEWEKALELAFQYGDNVLAEKFISGKEITVGIVGNKAMPVVEIQYPGQIFDYDAKYEHSEGETLYLCPPETVSYEIQEKAQEVSLKFAKALNVRDLTRIDLFVDENDDVTILEANNMPGFTPDSLLPKSAAQAGIPFSQLCGMLVQMAAERRKKGRIDSLVM